MSKKILAFFAPWRQEHRQYFLQAGMTNITNGIFKFEGDEIAERRREPWNEETFTNSAQRRGFILGAT